MSGGMYYVTVDGKRVGSVTKFMGEAVARRWVAASIYRLPGDQQNLSYHRTMKAAAEWLLEQAKQPA